MSQRIPSPRSQSRIRVLSQQKLEALVDRRKVLRAAGIGAVGGLGSQYVSLAGTTPRSRSYLQGAQDEELAIIIGTLGEAQSINPWRASDSEAHWRCKILYDEFVRQNPVTFTPEPGIAAEWTVDDLVITFTLQQNVMFSDGTPLTAEDIAFTLKGFLDTATGSESQTFFLSIEGAQAFADGEADDVSGISVIDEGTISLTLARPDAALFSNLRLVWPQPKALLEGQDLGTTDHFQNPVGAGPYKFESWTGNDFIAVANEHFWEAGKPAIQRVTHRFIGDSQTLVLALQNDEIDGSNYPNPAGVDVLEQNEDLDLIVPPFSAPDGWYFNCRHEVLGIKEVRQAIAMATDCEQFAADSLLGLGKAGLGPIAPDSWAFDPTLEPIVYDPAAAKQLIDDAGVSGAQIRFTTNSGNVLREDWLTFTQQAIEDIGIEVVPELLDFATLIEAVTQNRDFEVSGVNHAGVVAEPSALWDQFHSTSSANHCGLENAELDALLDEARGTLDQGAAIPIYADIQRIIMDEVPMHFAWYRPFLHTVNKTKFTGYQSSAAYGLFYYLQDWTAAAP